MGLWQYDGGGVEDSAWALVRILLRTEFAFLRSQVVTVTFPASVRGFWVSSAAVSTNFVVEPNLLR